MIWETYEKELEEIRDRIHQLELSENNEDNSWKTWFSRNSHQFIRKTCLERKAVWESLKVNIERKIKLIKEIQTDERNVLLIKFSTQLSKVEEKVAKLEARLSDLKSTEESQKLGNYFLIAILIILLIFFLYLIATGKILSESTGIKK